MSQLQTLFGLPFSVCLLVTLLACGCGGPTPSDTVDRNTLEQATDQEIDPGPAPEGQTEPGTDDLSGDGIVTPAMIETLPEQGPPPTHQVNERTPYYLTGPQQSSPPDGELAAKTQVRIIEESGSYTQIQTVDDVTAYVATDSLQPIEE